MSNVNVGWQKGSVVNGATITDYLKRWTRNGTVQSVISTPQTAAGDSSGYVSDWNTDFPSTPLQPNDVVDFAVATHDSVNGITSGYATSSPSQVVVPAPVKNLNPPTAVTLTLS